MSVSAQQVQELRALLGRSTVFVPVKAGDKMPWDHTNGRPLSGWQNTRVEQMTQEYLKNLELGNVGVLLGESSDDLCSFDIDDDSLVEDFLYHNPWFKESFRTRGARGANIWVRFDGHYPPSGKIVNNHQNDASGKPRAIGEFRALGSQTVAAGVHPKGNKYEILVNSRPTCVNWEVVAWPDGWTLSAKTAPKPAADRRILSCDDREALVERARRYVLKLPPAVSGQRGHDKTFHAACVLIQGFDLSQEEARLLLQEYNSKCAPPWSDSELNHKLESADTVADDRPKGFLARHPLYDERPKVQLPGANRLLSEFARECGELISKSGLELFQRDGLVLCVNPHRDGLKLMSDIAFRTWFEQVAVPIQFKKAGEGRELVSFGKTMSREDAVGTLQSEEFWSRLPAIRRFNTVGMPVMRKSGSIELLPTGYDEESQTFTEPKLEFDGSMSLESAKSIFSRLYAEFCFADNGRSKAVALASLLTPFCIGLMPPGSIRPCFIATANDCGAGKGTIIKASLIPAIGHAQTQTCPNNEDEMRKCLTTVIMEARAYLFLDNVRGKLISSSLEAFITAATWTDRLLGKSERIQGENLATVYISGNDLAFSPDLRRRSLFIELFLNVERAETRQFIKRLDDSTLLTQRSEILAAAWALVRNWDQNKRPKASKSSSSFPAWCEIVGGIVEAAGFGCPIAEPRLKSSADAETEDMRSLLAMLFEMKQGLSPQRDSAVLTSEFKFDEIMNFARQRGLFSDFLTQLVPTFPKEETSQNARLGKLLKRYDQRILGNGYRLTIQGAAHRRVFLVEHVHQNMVDMVDMVSGPFVEKPEYSN